MKLRTYYMHMLRGKPAYFTGKIIEEISPTTRARPLAISLNQIRREQRVSWKAWSMGATSTTDHVVYSYLLVGVPEEELGE